MAALRDRPPRPKTSRAKYNWLKELDEKVNASDLRETWRDELAEEDCPTFIMLRHKTLKRRHDDQVIAEYVRTGEALLQQSKNSDRVLAELAGEQRQQLAALVLDIKESLRTYRKEQISIRKSRSLSRDATIKLRMLSSRVERAKNALKSLRDYAHNVDPVLGLEYERLAKECLGLLSICTDPPPETTSLSATATTSFGYKRKDTSRSQDFIAAASSFAAEYFRAIGGPYRQFRDPATRGLVQVFWFFHRGAGISIGEAEVRVAMIANELLGMNLNYVSEDGDAESCGCDAVRKAVDRYLLGTNR